MKIKSYRLKPSKEHGFAGHQIVRDKRVRFTLNGREFKAYTGDTVLSALLANGVFGAGTAHSGVLSLDAGLQLCVRLKGTPDDASNALPMDSTFVRQGMELEIFGAPTVSLKGTFGRAPDASLKIDFETHMCVPGPLHDAPLTDRLKTNLLVVGGGLAGMKAAITAAEAGKNVMIIERRGYLGGDAELFGHADGEEDPRVTVAALKSKISKLSNIDVLVFANALSVEGRKLIAHVVKEVDGQPSPALIRISARKVVFATGAADRLPLFPGNRIPSVRTLTETFHLATAYGVWCGETSAIFTNSNIAYRFAGQAQNAGAKFVGIYDARTDRSSRFIDIAKAGGLKTVNGARVKNVAASKGDRALFIKLEPSFSGFPDLSAITADQLIINDGWQPRLDLWLQAGGTIQPDGTHDRSTVPEHMQLAGSCAGFAGHEGVQNSAVAAVERLFFKSDTAVIEDPQIDPHFETPAGPPSISSAVGNSQLEPCYASNTGSLVTIAGRRKTGFLEKLWKQRNADDATPVSARALSVVDTLNLTQHELLPPEELNALLRERAVAPRLFESGETRYNRRFLADTLALLVPTYIKNRFGEAAQLWSYTIESGVPMQTGVLLFPNTDVNDPAKSVGIVVGDGEVALVQPDSAHEDALLIARDAAQMSTIKLTKNMN